jgi:hypothetical protein
MKTTAQGAATVTSNVATVEFQTDRVRVLEFISNPGDKRDCRFDGGVP